MYHRKRRIFYIILAEEGAMDGMSALGYIVCGMFGLMGLGFVFMLALVVYDIATERAEKKKKEERNGYRKTNR